MKKVIVIGGKGTAVVVAEHIIDAATKVGGVEFLGYAFDDRSMGDTINGMPILCGTKEAWDLYGAYSDVYFVFQMYRTDRLAERVLLRDSYNIPIDRYLTFAHPSAVIMRSVTLGHGTVVMANVVIMPNARLGNHCTVLAGCTIGHDTVISDSNFFATQVTVGSGCNLGENNFYGMNSTINTRAKVGDNCVISMAANVVRDVPSGSMVRGNPARPVEPKIGS